MPGVEVWAQTLESMLTGNLLRRPGVSRSDRDRDRAGRGTRRHFCAALLESANRRAAVSRASSRSCSFRRLASFNFSKLLVDGIYPALSSALVFGVMLSENLRVAEAGRRRLAGELQHEREMEARMDGELNAARSIQMGLLPRHFPGPPEHRDVEVLRARSSPRGWSAAISMISSCSIRGSSFFAIADVSGKGVPAALFMAMTKEVLHTRDAALPQGARSGVQRGERQDFRGERATWRGRART